MKATNLNDFMERLASIERDKNDYVVPSEKMVMTAPGTLQIQGLKDFDLNQVSHSQLASKLDIPKKYYDKISGIEGLREHNVNTLLRKNTDKYTIRTVNNTARAVLSDRYLPVDNFMILNEVMPVFMGFPGAEIKSSSLTDKRMYMQIVFPHTTKDIVKGDAVQYGLTLSNSEVGLGAIKVESTIWRLVCSNGMIGKSIVNRKHVGRRITEEDNMDLFRRETIKADLKAFTMKLADIIKYSLEESQIEALYAPLREAQGIRVEKPEETIQNITKRFGLKDTESQHVLRNMLQENNWSKYGIINGVTNAAHITDSADRQYDLERIGNDILTLPANQWEVLSA
jgi:hypothetical protein